MDADLLSSPHGKAGAGPQRTDERPADARGGDAATGIVGMLLYDFRASGVVRNALRIAAAARAAGIDARLWPVRPQGDLLGAIPPDIPVEPLHNRTTVRQRDLDSLLAVPALIRALEARRPSVLFSCGNQIHFYAALAARRAGNRRAFRFVGRASNAVTSVGANPLRKLLRPFERFQFRSMDRIVAVSHELGIDLVDGLGIAPAGIEIVPNGIDIAAVAARGRAGADHPFFRTPGPPVVVAIGRLSRQKNFPGLIRAFAMARARRNMRLLIIGPGSSGVQRRLVDLARKLGLGQDFSLRGFVENPFPYLSQADLFVLSSLWEGASNVLLEALACGCPIVATRAPTGVSEVLLDGALGPLVPPDDDPALAAAMLDRLSRPRGEAMLVARAAQFDLGPMLVAYVRLLDPSGAVPVGADPACSRSCAGVSRS